MISCTAKGVTYPLDTTQLYWLANTGHENPLIDFYFSNAAGTLLVPALDDVPRFQSAVEAVILGFPTAPCVRTLAQVLQLLTPPAPVPPRYPQACDTGVTGIVIRVFTGDGWAQFWNHNVDPPVQYQVWAGIVKVDIGGTNGYSTPPAYDNGNFGFLLAFHSLTPIIQGKAATFDIYQAPYAIGATNIRQD